MISPPMMGVWSRRSAGQVQSKVRLVKGVWVPHREGTLRLNTNSCNTWYTCSKVSWSMRTKGAM